MNKSAPTTSAIKFSLEENIALARLVEVNPLIWNLQTPLHSNIRAVSAAWEDIAGVLKKKVAECKAAWRSLKDAKRYRTKKRKLNSGSAADLELEDGAMEEWQYEECMAFFINYQSMRKTMTSGGHEESPPPPNQSVCSDDVSRTNYSFSSQNRNQPVQVAEEVLEVSKNIRDMMKNFADTSTRRETQYIEMKYYPMLLNIDRMLQKIPPERVEELNARWTVELYNIIEEERLKKIKNLSFPSIFA